MITLPAISGATYAKPALVPVVPMPEPSADWRKRHLELDESVHPKVATMARNAEWIARACLRDNRTWGTWLVIAGKTGCGKTHVAERVARYVAARQIDAWSRGWWSANHIPSPVFVRWEDVAGMKDEIWADVRQDMQRARLIVLDDIGAEVDRYKSGAPSERLKAAMESADGKWLLATTNVKRDAWEHTWGARVADRMRQARYLSMFEVKSYRGKDKA